LSERARVRRHYVLLCVTLIAAKTGKNLCIYSYLAEAVRTASVRGCRATPRSAAKRRTYTHTRVYSQKQRNAALIYIYSYLAEAVQTASERDCRATPRSRTNPNPNPLLAEDNTFENSLGIIHRRSVNKEHTSTHALIDIYIRT